MHIDLPWRYNLFFNQTTMIRAIRKFFENFLGKWLWWVLAEKMKEEVKILWYNPNEKVNQKNYQRIIDFLRKYTTVKIVQTLEDLKKENIQDYDAVIYFHFVKEEEKGNNSDNLNHLKGIIEIVRQYPDLLLVVYAENQINRRILDEADNLYIMANMPATLISNLFAILFAKKL